LTSKQILTKVSKSKNTVVKSFCSIVADLPRSGSFGFSADDEDFFNYENPAVDEQADDFDMVLKNACRAALRKGLVSDPNDLLVVTAGIPFGTPGAANIIRLLPAAGPSCWDGVCRVEDV